MKFTAIAKAIFVLGILTTSVMITENQSVNAKGKYEKMNRLYDTNKLHQYYSGPSYELTNVSGQSQGYYDSNVLLFNQQNQKFQVFLLGKDENKYKEKTHGLDVFAVPELVDLDGRIFSVSGITKKNVRSVFGFVSNPSLQVKKIDPKHGFSINELFFIQKEEVSLKELDFKIRKMLVEKYRLYKGASDKGRIVINMKDEKKYVIDLSEKLSFDRMFDVMDSKQIKNIEVNLN
ncbi:superantigen-like protein SSL8 [Staphylococcus aureus]|uniref:superantigen-like protein SSL8 n=1 Tax=Staphylococcus aureus TaxID=1280 RepID=UPI0007C9FD4D|nr:superantigen-like protein SSL8 [Staphylococcus aureus]EJX2314768.1 superantigen-like protein SSL8 [Staphylococcus aureus]MBG1144696.1 superantigen-like protein SSL8 [Staphylococcus aureus]MCS4747597.1 superantigen-like protein SSL8 [Staphylococcus aureus]MCV9445591.1 superantigen-like protein SSL8 [Staphylococcus aureus]MDV0231639.1 superantigen-like protein SSL8 [Staphylococcus aureus]